MKNKQSANGQARAMGTRNFLRAGSKIHKLHCLVPVLSSA